MTTTMKCDNCGRIAPQTYSDQPNGAWHYAGEESLSDFVSRFDVGGIYTDAECPDCGALAYPV